MQIYELINYLNLIAGANGDLPVYVLDGGCEFPLEKDILNVEKEILTTTSQPNFDDKPKRLQITVI